MIKPNLNSKRMEYVQETYFDNVNMLYGLDKLCQDIGLNKNSIILEIGCYKGISTSLFAFYSKKVYAVDVWFSPELKNNIIPEYKNIEFIQGKSENILPTLQDNFFDIIYIDGDHSYECVKKDIINSIPKLKKNGYLSGHDYDELKKNDVYQAVNELCNTSIKVYEDQSWAVRL